MNIYTPPLVVTEFLLVIPAFSPNGIRMREYLQNLDKRMSTTVSFFMAQTMPYGCAGIET